LYVTIPDFLAIDQAVAEIQRFIDFQNVGRPPSWIFKNLADRVWRISVRYHVSVKLLLGYDSLLISSKWRPSAILNLLYTFSDHPRSVLGGLYC